MSRLLLDTGVWIGAERRGSEVGAIIDDRDDVVIAAITAAELLEGVERASGKRKEARSAFVESILSSVPIVDYSLGIARRHARLLSEVHSAGQTRGAHDLIIAATALVTDRELVTSDMGARFERLAGLTVRTIPNE